MKRCILLLVDGLRPDVAERELAQGHLPNLAHLTGRGGAGRGITAFPSTTSVAYLPFLTGCLPGTCNIPSIRWLDRQNYGGRWWTDREAVRSYCGYQAGMLDDDIHPEIQTIFNLVPESAAFFTMITRGLSPERDPLQSARKRWGAVSHYLLWHQPGDDAVSDGLMEWIDRDPSWRFLFAQFPAVDGYTHQTTPDHPKVLRAFRRFDVTVGRLRQSLEARGLLDDTLILMVSDHGATVVKHHLDLAEWFRRHGVPTLAHPELWTSNPEVAVMVAGNGSAMVYAKPNEPRHHRWGLSQLRSPMAFNTGRDLVGTLIRERGVAFVAAQDPDGVVRVLDRHGEASIRQLSEEISYTRHTGDPLAIGADLELSHRQWLEHTFHGDYPDAAVQLLDQFRSPRTGDLLVVAREGTDFRDRWEIPEHKAGHGSLFTAHMQIPIWANRPLPPTPLRSVDLFPAMLNWLGIPLPSKIDGESVWHPQGHGR